MRHVACFLLLIASATATAQAPAVVAAGTGDLAKAQVFTPERGRVRVMPNGGESRDIVRAALPTGEAIGIHESVQRPGAVPNAPHKIQHSEFILVRAGTLAFEHDGLSESAGPGSIIYVPYGTLHTLRNAGKTAARYVVIAVGGDQRR